MDTLQDVTHLVSGIIVETHFGPRLSCPTLPLSLTLSPIPVVLHCLSPLLYRPFS